MEPFTIEAFQNPYLVDGADRVDAILTVTAATGAAMEASPADLVLGFILDTSGSMEGARIRAVRTAAESALRLLDERATFFVVAFANFGRVVVPPTTATPDAKRAAIRAIEQLRAAGGTAMSQGLGAARSLFSGFADAIRQCVFLTDGKNESEHPVDVTEELAQCAGLFTCDCWGVGTDWQVGEVQEIARALLGKATLIPEPEGIDAAFRTAVERAQSKAVRDVRVRVWTPVAAEVVAFKQVSPTIEDYTARALPVSAQVRDFATGAWAAGESRDYQVAVRVAPGHVGDQMLAARPSVVFSGPDGHEAEV
jgi:hypothetical protein